MFVGTFLDRFGQLRPCFPPDTHISGMRAVTKRYDLRIVQATCPWMGTGNRCTRGYRYCPSSFSATWAHVLRVPDCSLIPERRPSCEPPKLSTRGKAKARRHNQATQAAQNACFARLCQPTSQAWCEVIGVVCCSHSRCRRRQGRGS